MSDEREKLLTLDQVAAELQVSYETARQLTVKGRLEYTNAGTGEVREVRRVSRDALDRFKTGERRAGMKQEFADARSFVRAGQGGGPW